MKEKCKTVYSKVTFWLKNQQLNKKNEKNIWLDGTNTVLYILTTQEHCILNIFKKIKKNAWQADLFKI